MMKCDKCMKKYHKYDFTHLRHCRVECWNCNRYYKDKNDLKEHYQQSECMKGKKMQCTKCLSVESLGHTAIECLDNNLKSMFDLMIHLITKIIEQTNVEIDITDIKQYDIKKNQWNYQRQFSNQKYIPNTCYNLMEKNMYHNVEVVAGTNQIKLQKVLDGTLVNAIDVCNGYYNQPPILKNDYIISRNNDLNSVSVVDLQYPKNIQMTQFDHNVKRILRSLNQDCFLVIFENKLSTIFEYDLAKMDEIKHTYEIEFEVKYCVSLDSSLRYVLNCDKTISLRDSLMVKIIEIYPFLSVKQLISSKEYILMGQTDKVEVMRQDDNKLIMQKELAISGDVRSIQIQNELLVIGSQKEIQIWNFTKWNHLKSIPVIDQSFGFGTRNLNIVALNMGSQSLEYSMN